MFFPSDDGSRQILGVGPFLGDMAFVDLATGVQSFPEALIQEARKRKFEMIICLSVSGDITFGTDQMKTQFYALTEVQSRDPQRSNGAHRAASPVSENQPLSSAQKQEVDRLSGDGLAGALGKIDRAVSKFTGSIFILLPDVDDLVIPETIETERARKLVEIIGRLLAPGRSHVRSQIIVFSADTKAGKMKELLSKHGRGVLPWNEVRPNHPDSSEIENFLERAKARHSLQGNVKAIAILLGGRQYSLLRVAQAVSIQIHDGKTDLSAIIGSEYDEQRVADVQAKLDALVGMEEIKQKLNILVKLARNQQEAIQRGEQLELPSTHIALLGRPGTGKTIVAKIIAELLHASGVRRSQSPPVEIGVKDIVSAYNEGDTLQNMSKHLASAAGGVLFIDEAYGLAGIYGGQGAVTTLVDEMEKRRGDLTVILAGYPERMEELFQVNEGLRSRIPNEYIIHLRDYTPEEMCTISDSMIGARKVTIDTDARAKSHKLIKREVTRRHSNGREVRNLVESWDKVRLSRGGHRFELADIVDPRNVSIQVAEQIIAQFEQKFVDMKEAVAWMRTIVSSTADSIRRGKLENAPRLLFLGPPGTGKTETARIVGDFLRALGVLRNGRVREVSLQDFSSGHQGGVEERTRSLFEECREGVLFIDEAYRFADDQQGNAVLHQIVQHLTDPEFDSVCLVMAGYDEQMRKLMNTNPGLASRFTTQIRFEWPSPTALAEIACRFLESNYGLKPSVEEQSNFIHSLQTAIETKRCMENFAGARTAHNVANVVRFNALAARRTEGLCAVADIPQGAPPPTMEETIGSFRMKFIDQPLLEEKVMYLIAEFVRRLPTPPDLALGIRLLGAPGTGKSTFARWLMSTFAARVGAAAAPEVEISAQSLMGEYVGNAQGNVDRVFDRARGGFLFIDEFHALAPIARQQDAFGLSVIQQIVANMQMPNNVRTTVLLAGYPEPMRNAFQSDVGLLRRFPFEILVPPPSEEVLARITIRLLRQKGPMHEIQDQTILPLFTRHFTNRRIAEGESFGNCGAANNLAGRILNSACIRNNFTHSLVTMDDIVMEMTREDI